MGQVPIVLNREVEGFIVNRLQGALLREAFRLVDGGYVAIDDLDKAVRDGLGLRWSFMGPMETIDLNAPGGLADYMARYGHAFTRLAPAAGTSAWSPTLIDKAEADRRTLLPMADHAARQAWRDRRLMALISHKDIAAKAIGE